MAVRGPLMYEPSFVYVISMPAGYQKIGMSDQPMKRVQALQVAHPQDLELIHVVATRRPVEVERCAHSILRAHRARGEWFLVTREQAIDAVNLAVKRRPDPAPGSRAMRELQRRQDELMEKRRAYFTAAAA